MATVQDEPGQPPNLTSLSLAETSQGPKIKEQIITPFDVSGGTDEHGKLLAIDYDKIIGKFGATPVDKRLLDRFERLTGKKAHRFLRRGIVFSHRELDQILDQYEKRNPFYIYTGRGPSSDSMHVGHSIPFEFTKYLQDVFDAPLVIMLTDDEKFMHTPKLKVEECKRFAEQNAKDIIAIGFDARKTFIFSDFAFVKGPLYENAVRIARRTTVSQIKGTFGYKDDSNIGEVFFPAVQSATAFASSFPGILGDDTKKLTSMCCLIPCAIDQDPYFRQCRDNARQLGFIKPALIHSIFLPALQGPGSKMSASIPDSGILLSDTPNQIKRKVNKFAFSGGQDTEEKHRQLGGRTKDDVAFQYLTFFLEDDDELAKIKDDYEAGRLLTGELKAVCIRELQIYVKGFQERRGLVTDETVADFMRERRLVFRGNFNSKDGDEEAAADEFNIKKLEERITGLQAELDRLKSKVSKGS